MRRSVLVICMKRQALRLQLPSGTIPDTDKFKFIFFYFNMGINYNYKLKLTVQQGAERDT